MTEKWLTVTKLLDYNIAELIVTVKSLIAQPDGRFWQIWTKFSLETVDIILQHIIYLLSSIKNGFENWL